MLGKGPFFLFFGFHFGSLTAGGMAWLGRAAGTGFQHFYGGDEWLDRLG
jgi:hypothetical protein